MDSDTVMKSPSADAFRQLYTELQMERDGLFTAVARAYRCQTVLYPGCSIHVNPSFHFPHVVYVDTSDTARRCFAAAADVLRSSRIASATSGPRMSAFCRWTSRGRCRCATRASISCSRSTPAELRAPAGATGARAAS